MKATRRQLLSACACGLGTQAWRLSAFPAFHSLAGVLDAYLEAKQDTVVTAGKETEHWGYSGATPGPMFELRPGDTLRLRLRNSLPEPTNLHFHGLHVSPSGNGDNTFIEVLSGEQFDYDVQIPANHRPGMYWYHPHMHGTVARQVFRGLAGLIIIRGDLDAIPEIALAQEQMMVLQDFTVDRSGRIVEPNLMERMQGREGSTLTVNGEVNPAFWIQRNGLLRCRFLNASVSRYYRLKIEEHPLAVIALDGGALRSPKWVDEWLLVPGQRVDILVRGERPPGTYRILNLPYDRGSTGMTAPLTPQAPLVLGHMNYSGTAEQSLSVPETLLNVENLPVPALQRRLVLTEGMMASFLINGRSFRADRTDTRVQLGAIEDWEIENRGQMDHPFHMHVNAFQPVAEDGVAEPAWHDVINVPRNARRRIRIPFTDFPGRTLYHCHILDHEDLGMMGTLEIAG